MAARHGYADMVQNRLPGCGHYLFRQTGTGGLRDELRQLSGEHAVFSLSQCSNWLFNINRKPKTRLKLLLTTFYFKLKSVIAGRYCSGVLEGSPVPEAGWLQPVS
ncbi:MAG: hypothetical protein PHU23_11810 [Dehalococcoidales bacterium]|nr:hypothetical protein [Dehalococcoidales bacterium]